MGLKGLFSLAFSSTRLSTADHVHNDETFQDNQVQFARMLAVLSEIGLTKKQIHQIQKRTGLSSSRILHVQHRAIDAWNFILERTDENGYAGGADSIAATLMDSRLYQVPPADDPNAFLQIEPCTHQFYAEVDPDGGSGLVSLTQPPMPGSALDRGLVAEAAVSDGSALMLIHPPGRPFLEVYEEEGIGTVVSHGKLVHQCVVDGSLVQQFEIGAPNDEVHIYSGNPHMEKDRETDSIL